MFSFSERLQKLPPYLFVELDRMKAEVQAKGVDVIDLGVGDPDLPTPSHIVEAAKKALDKPENHHYPSSAGMLSFRQAAANWMKNRFGVELDPQKEVVALIGSKEGIAHFPLAFVNPGDVVLVPTPAYPVYHIGTLFAGGETYYMPLLPENNFLPDLKSIPEDILSRAKILWLNYPNNPTAAVADKNFFAEVIAFAKEHNLIVAHDAAYTELFFDDYVPPSILEVEGAKEVAIEFHSLSKTYCMTGWRIAFAVGNETLVTGLTKVKNNVDSGAFQVVQEAAIAALTGDQQCVADFRNIFKKRRNVLVEGLKKLGFQVEAPKATFYVWARVPEGYTSADFAAKLLKEAGIVVTPGNGFGEPGEGFFRVALTVDEKRLEEAIKRISSLKF
ncbi:LL-diaminopimelate aminotransferase [Thermodesulfatator indicus DSM 15286]|uniref:LL-diaminopimelate aminotransferase n=1 Tax=Thermodesulfatator indicus (strain DSM 15286 / JCM 11887 / CIR29812) TaxID=667014 RepID=F8AC72_THEID|nr:LL-diaminopimelate aminotransferase [Thermodesulfatator indicus]AEH44633.1 LL-diaminopimelate aminotransferase [Thermodesulfatator indicus DSM 15286]